MEQIAMVKKWTLPTLGRKNIFGKQDSNSFIKTIKFSKIWFIEKTFKRIYDPCVAIEQQDPKLLYGFRVRTFFVKFKICLRNQLVFTKRHQNTLKFPLSCMCGKERYSIKCKLK